MICPLAEVRRSCQLVSAQASHVSINNDKVLEVAQNLKNFIFSSSSDVLVEWDACSWHYNQDVHELGPKTCQYIFVLDSLNFCFWPTEGLEYDTLALSLKKVLEADESAFDAENLANIDDSTLQSWFPTHNLPNLEERTLRLRELGSVLLSEFDGLAINLVKRANRSCSTLVRLILQYFQGFRDTSLYRSRLIHLYKRVQILVGDLWAAYGRGEENPILSQEQEEEGTSGSSTPATLNPFAFDDIHLLTMFPDYRVPQILRDMGVLEYTSELASTIDSLQPLLAGCEEEVEIRACTVVAVERIQQEMTRLGREIETSTPPSPPSSSSSSPLSQTLTLSQLKVIELDWLLWQMGEERRFELKPHHRTLTIYY